MVPWQPLVVAGPKRTELCSAHAMWIESLSSTSSSETDIRWIASQMVAERLNGDLIFITDEIEIDNCAACLCYGIESDLRVMEHPGIPRGCQVSTFRKVADALEAKMNLNERKLHGWKEFAFPS